MIRSIAVHRERSPRAGGRACTLTSALLLALVLAPAAVAQQTERAKSIGKRLLCLCDCNQILTECNHVGCSMSSEMLKKLDRQVARNEPEDLTIQSFVQEYGERVLAQPSAKGFSLVAWIMPIVAVIIGLLLIRALLLRWHRPMAPAPAGPEISAEFLERARRQADLESEE